MPAEQARSSLLICPKDRHELQEEGASLRCPSCGQVYRANQDDVIDVIGPSGYYWGEIPADQMARVLEHARLHGHDAAIDDLLGKEIDPAYRDSLRDPTRTDWRLLLGFGRGHRVLDVGSGWGRLTFALAPCVGELYSLEYVAERLEFQRIAREQRGDRNIHLVHGSFTDLPFADSALDWIIFNGVLEWVGLAGTRDPHRMQMEVLRRSFEILKPDGRVLIAIENRWGGPSFLGAKDHSGLAFTNLMPRWLADVYVRFRKRRYRNDREPRGYRTYTYGLRGYVKMMRRAGFGPVSVHAALPSYNRPRIILPLYPVAAKAPQLHVIDEQFRRRSLKAHVARRAFRALIRLGIAPLIYPHYLVVAQKPHE